MKHDISAYVREHRGKYLLINSISRRVRDLQSGHKALVPPRGELLDIATEEFRQGMMLVNTRSDEEQQKQEA
jgi:DNA-directed RNA polymerase subunit K/omega